jgi:preprotein translocase subunit SecG
MRLFLDIVLLLTSVLLIFFVLLHKGQGGGISDMFGGGMSSGFTSSGVAEKNLNRLTIIVSVLWLIAIIILGIIVKSTSS